MICTLQIESRWRIWISSIRHDRVGLQVCFKMVWSKEHWSELKAKIWNREEIGHYWEVIAETQNCLKIQRLAKHNPWISVLTGFIAGTDFWHFLYCWKYQNMVLLSFEHLEKIRIFQKSGGRSSKIVPAMPISILSF